MTAPELTRGEMISSVLLGAVLGGIMVALLAYTGWLQ
jgi:purine-cytosine permease-like protein